MVKRNLLWFLIIFSAGLTFSANKKQDQAKISKGQLLDAPKIVRSETATLRAKAVTSTIFEDDFETGGTLWSLSGSWAIGSPTSGPNSGHNSINLVATNLSGDYNNNEDSWLISSNITLPSIKGPDSNITLNFWEWFRTESGYDYGKVKISSDGGKNWVTLDSRDGRSDWRKTIIDLSSYAGRTVKIAFHFTSDGSVTYAGWYIDDIQIVLEQPEPLSATIVSLNHQNFPFIYMNVAVDTFGVGFPNLIKSI